MRSKVIIVDDFYAKPDRMRELALSAEYADITATDYPGWQSRQNLRTDAIQQAFARLVGAPIYVDHARFTWGGFRFITAGTGELTKVHADTSIDWAGMVYLTPDAPPSAGTGFFRHRETGLSAPPTDRQARAMGFVDAAQFEDEVVHRDMADLSKWEEVGRIGPVYNRLILFRGSEVYHAPLGGCGDSPETARLTHSFFFNELPRPVTIARKTS
jgi:Family of unknown function (DUF6445)